MSISSTRPWGYWRQTRFAPRQVIGHHRIVVIRQRGARCYASRRSLAWSPRGPGSLRIWLDARALQERDAGERGQPVHQLVLERRVTGLRGGRLPLPGVLVAAAHGGGGGGGGRQPWR